VGLLAGAGGDPRVAVGTGRNLPLYPEDVRLTGIELSPMMLAVAWRRARQERLEADLRVGDAQDLQFPNASFDGVVAPLALCTIPVTCIGE
jgi:ubiquinone/menaquinone biosynthesis C-methylase UbiE